MKYLKKFENHTKYELASQNLILPNVSLCKQEDEVHYNPYIPLPPQLLDILYSDVNGNLSFTSEVLPISEGKTPIGLCVAGTGFFGENEPARWMSLKYMHNRSPETGSITGADICWGNYGTDINTIDNISTTYNGGSNTGYLTADWITNTNNKIPSLFDANDNWNLAELGDINQFAVTDIDGKNKTEKLLATATAQSDWRTAETITSNDKVGYAPAACCCARYHTLGTQENDWYLGACGEMSMILVKQNEINTKLAAINTIYQNDCISSLFNREYWTSSEYNNDRAYEINTSSGNIKNDFKINNHNIIAMLQY